MRALDHAGVEALGTYRSQRVSGAQPLDVTDADQVRACLAGVRPDVVFLPTNARGGVDYCEDHPEDIRSLIVGGTRNVLGAAPANARLVLYSSDYVFDGRRGPYSEDDLPAPINEYGRAKL